MLVPIQYALTYPNRFAINQPKLSLTEIGNLSFKKIDEIRYPAIKLAFQAGRIGGSMPTVLNAANEVAVSLFLKEAISFLDIEKIVETAMENHIVVTSPSIAKIIEIDQNVRKEILNS